MMEELIQKYHNQLTTLKENRAASVDTNADAKNEQYNRLIQQTTEFVRELKHLNLTMANKQHELLSDFHVFLQCNYSHGLFGSERVKAIREFDATGAEFKYVIRPISDHFNAIRAEGKLMATCNNFVSKMAGKSNEGYKEIYMKGLEFALNKIDNF